MDKIVIICLGRSDSGKSTTWNTLFGNEVRTGRNTRLLWFNDIEFLKSVFLVSGSPQERGKYVSEIIGSANPSVVFCSIQYHETAIETIDWFIERGYFPYIQWLNPGYHDNEAYYDYLGIEPQILSRKTVLTKRAASTSVKERAGEILDFLYGWAAGRNLILRKP